jgi:serpin B
LAKDTAGAQNVFISPLSVALALSMAYNGARGDTQRAMAGALGLGSMAAGDLNAGSAALLAHLRGLDRGIELSLADSLWLRQGMRALPAFRQALLRYYGARTTTLDFGDPRAPAAINAWVSRQTHGLIQSIIERIPTDMVLYLIDALYFKGAWSAPFQAGLTRPGPFTPAGGGRRTLPMMSSTGSYRYNKTQTYEAISLPYGAGKVAMYIVLPAASSGLRGLQNWLDAGTWQGLPATLQEAMGTIVLPRFTVDYGTGLKTALVALGMGLAFDPLRADLSAMVELDGQRAYIGDARHKTVLKVDERGTLAAAVTSIGVAATAMPMSTFKMTVNRPFFCAIRDETTGLLLFMGGIADPVGSG